MNAYGQRSVNVKTYKIENCVYVKYNIYVYIYVNIGRV